MLSGLLRRLPLAWAWRGLTSGSVVLFGALMFGNGVAYIYLMLVARVMSPGEYGALVTLTSTSYVLAVVMRTIQAWVVKAVSSAPGGGARRVPGLFLTALRALVPVATVVLAGYWLASGWVADFLHLDSAVPVIVLGLYSFSSFLVPVPRGVLLGLNRLQLAGAVHVVEDLARLVGGLALVVLGLGVNGALAGYAIGNVVSFALALIWLWPLLARHRGQATQRDGLGGIDRYASVLLIANTCLMVMASVDQIAVKHFFSDQVAGNYAVAFLLGRVIVMSTVALGWVVFTRSATMPVADPRRLRLFATGLAVIGSIAAVLTAGYLVAPGLAIHLMGGSQYEFAADYVGLVGIEMTLFALVYVQAYYHISVKSMRIIWPLSLAVLLEISLLATYHDTVQQILLSLIIVMGTLLVCVSAMSWWMLRAAGRSSRVAVRGSPETATNTP